MSTDNEFILSMAFGGLIIIFFAWDRFKQPSYLNDLGSMRLIELLAPTDLRRGNVYFRAYAFYAIGLLAFYVIFCFYSDLLAPPIADYFGLNEIANQIGATSAPEQAGFPDGGPGKLVVPESTRNPDFPLYVSLIIVGLVPTFPGFKKLEEKWRFAAHRMSGIPTRMIAGQNKLKRADLILPDEGEGLLISKQDWERLQFYQTAVEGKITEVGVFKNDLRKIIAFQSWILREKLVYAHQRSGRGIFDLVAELSRRTEQLISSLDSLTGFGLDGEGVPSGGAPQEGQHAKWDALAREAGALCDDYCILIMLLSEHGSMPWNLNQGFEFALVDDVEPVAGPEPDPLGGKPPMDAKPVMVQRSDALAIFKAYAREADKLVDEGTVTYMLWARTSFACAVIAFLWGLFLGNPTNGPDGFGDIIAHFKYGVTLSVNALLTYSLAVLVCLTYHQAEMRNRDWDNVFQTSWARWLPKLAFVFVLSLLVSMLCYVAYQVIFLAAQNTDGPPTPRSEWYVKILEQFSFSVPLSLPAPFLGIFIIMVVDLWATKDSQKAFFAEPAGDTATNIVERVYAWLPGPIQKVLNWLVPTRNRAFLITAVIVMFLVGAVSRVAAFQISDSIWYAAQDDPYQHIPFLDQVFNTWIPFGCETETPRAEGCRQDLRVLRQGVLAAIICFFSIKFTQSTLLAYFWQNTGKTRGQG